MMELIVKNTTWNVTIKIQSLL